MTLMAKTKIIVTIGPACDDQKTIEKLILTGASVFRFNYKHNSFTWHDRRMKRAREAAKKLAVPVGLMVDLKGPELRIGRLKGGRIKLEKGEIFTFGSGGQIVFSVQSVLGELKKGQPILLDDGRIELVVMEEGKTKVKVKVITGGLLESNKGLNLPGTEIDLPTLGDKDIEAIKLAKKHGVDFVALSFVREREDMRNLKRTLEKERLEALCIAKIENRSAIENLEEILIEADGIMVARGDLGVELPVEETPFWQKYIIDRCLKLNKPVITATEMLSSMIVHPRPTRAEVSDIANSVYDRSDALLLSTETAIGKYPLKAVAVMRRTCEFIEAKMTPMGREGPAHEQIAAIVLAAFNLVQESDLPQPLSAFIVLTENGKTARLLSSLRPNLPILAITPKKNIRDQLCLSFGVVPFFFDYEKDEVGEAIKKTIGYLQRKGKLKTGEKVVIIYGDDWRFPGRTNLVRIQEV